MSGITGGCLCGVVRFEVTGAFSHFHLCHCAQCQRSTGSAFASNLFAESGSINWLSGTESIRRFDVPGRSISNSFCASCGSALPYESRSGRASVIPAGSLDAGTGLAPEHHIFWRERASWYDAARHIACDDTFGPDDA